MLRALVARLVSRAAMIFYRVERVGDPVPDGPALVVANHPNSLLDPILVFRAVGRPARPLAKAPLFRHPLIGPVLQALGGLPVFRRQDDPDLVHRNDGTFEAAVAALLAGEAVQIFPEGITHSRAELAPLRTGAARLAFQAEERAGWKLGLSVVPVGLIYRRKTLFRGEALVVVGRRFAVADRRARYEADPRQAARELTARIADALTSVTLAFQAAHDEELVDAAERLYVRQRGWAGWRQREGLAVRLPRLRRFGEGLEWLRRHDPTRHRRLAAAVRRYRRLTAALGAGDADVPPHYRLLDVARYAASEGLLLALGTPLALLAVPLWIVPYWIPRLAVPLARPEFEAIATYKLSAAVLAYPLAYAGWLLLALRAWGGWGLVVAAVAAPMAGLAAVGWWERWRRVREDAALLLRTFRRPRTRRRIAALRERLAREFESLAEVVPSGDGAAARPAAEA